MNAFYQDQQAISPQQFQAAAIDPRHSVAIEACAGSGKTTLLVARILRILLQGQRPDEILAISFTRKAAAEVNERLEAELLALANANETELAARLNNLQLTPTAADSARARSLHALCYGQQARLQVSTFHAWFVTLLQQLPLSAGLPAEFELLDEHAAAQLKARCWRELLAQQIATQTQNNLRTLYHAFGDATTQNLLEQFFAYRNEWLLAHQTQDDAALVALTETSLPLARTVADFFSGEQLQLLARITAAIEASKSKNAADWLALLQTLDGLILSAQQPSVADADWQGLWQRLVEMCLTQAGQARNWRSKALNSDDFQLQWQALCEAVIAQQKALEEHDVIRLNACLMQQADLWIRRYQQAKADAQQLDFADLELHLLRLIRDESYGAYFLTRLEARTRHILIDEFQDTNPVQWQIVQSWLQGVIDAGGDQPVLFLVGDPKQSIYRFRRADPRVFDAAQAWLRAHFAASVQLQTDHTWRNAPAITATLNQVFTANPRYRAHSSGATASGQVMVLPLIQAPQNTIDSDSAENSKETSAAATQPPAAEFQWPDPLVEKPFASDEPLRELEGAAIAQQLLQLHQQQQVPWADMMLLMRSRTHFSDYARALRAAGIPYRSDTVSQWHDRLEIKDCLALATFFLWQDNLSLAHVLSSPLFNWRSADLNAFVLWQRAQTGYDKKDLWWPQLPQFLAEHADSSRGQQQTQDYQQLQRWLTLAPQRSLYELFDQIFADANVPACYLPHVAAADHDLVRHHLEGFLETTLAYRAGRYPSLAEFIHDFPHLPAPPLLANHQDAVRFLTIHGAKGMQADVIVLLDSNTRGKETYQGILIDWPLAADAPQHFSAYWGRDGAARDTLFATEQQYATQEEWNLFYVACTRAKRFLILSGVVDGARRGTAGLNPDSWYARMQAVMAADQG